MGHAVAAIGGDFDIELGVAVGKLDFAFDGEAGMGEGAVDLLGGEIGACDEGVEPFHTDKHGEEDSDWGVVK